MALVVEAEGCTQRLTIRCSGDAERMGKDSTRKYLPGHGTIQSDQVMSDRWDEVEAPDPGSLADGEDSVGLEGLEDLEDLEGLAVTLSKLCFCKYHQS